MADYRHHQRLGDSLAMPEGSCIDDLAGAEVDSFYGFGPTIGAALNVTLMSYRGTCDVGVNIDTGAVPDPDVMMECLRQGFDEVLAVRQ